MAERHRVAGFDVPIVRDVDVLVVGGGPAGIAAAIGAAQSGMRVLLTEHYGFLGGAHASGEIGTFCGLYATSSEEHVATFIGRGTNRALLNALHGITTGTRPQAAITGPQRWFNVSAAAMAVRETRLIEGEYRLTGDDVLSGRKFDDGIAYSAWPMEKMEGATVQLSWMNDGLLYEVPYRCLIPTRLDGILVAGRCLSAERAAHASARTWALCMDMGEAAGMAAAQAVTERKGVREVDVELLRRRLSERSSVSLAGNRRFARHPQGSSGWEQCMPHDYW